MRYATFVFATMLSFGADKLTYPPAARGNHVDDYHGTKVPDPYRWMEENDTPQLKAWIEAQNKLTAEYLSDVPQREAIRKRLTELANVVRNPGYLTGHAGALSRNGTLFFLRQEPGRNQPILYIQPPGRPAQPLLDPNTLSKDGTVALLPWEISDDGKWLAYGLSKAGSDWQEIRIRSIETRQDLPEVIEWTKFTAPSWSADNKGFYYSRYPQPEAGKALTAANTGQKVFYHALRTPQSEDKLIFERSDRPDWRYIESTVSTDGAYLIIDVARGAGEGKNLVLYRDLSSNRTVELINQFEDEYVFLANRGTRFFFRTTYQAPRGRIIAIDIAQPERNNWKEIIPQREWALEDAVVNGDKLVLKYLRDATSYLRTAALDGSGVQDLAMPGIGTIALGRPSKDSALLYSFTNYTTPMLLYRVDPKPTPLEKRRLPFNPDDYETRQVFYHSKDGTRVPMVLVHRKGLQRNGSAPTLLYGYGGFNIAVTPGYLAPFLGWLDLGGIFAIANLRGGGEYGREWHEAGMKLKKQNVFDDFIAAAEYLIANDYTSKSKLAIMGGSNGGLLVGAVLNQRPELFGAAVPMVGVMDMLRFHKFTVGAGWMSDYGSADDPEEFKALRAYSPLHNIRKGTVYPPTLVITADHDDRVVPAHSFKYAAAMQYAQEGNAPILARIGVSAGHGAGKPISKQVDEYTDVLAFLVKALAIPSSPSKP